jgi:hypothetical protein
MSPARDRETVADVGGVPHTRFVVVLALMLALLFWLVGPGADLDSRLLLEVTVGVAIVSAAVAAEDGGRRRWTILFGVLTVLLNAMWGGGHSLARTAGPGSAALFAAYATLRAVRVIVRSRRVTGDVLAGALAAYVLAGLAFAIVYGVIEVRSPGAFRTGADAVTFSDVVYFSFVTLLTVGFGDVTPAAATARAVAIFEGLFGVAYTTVVMAALVAAYLDGRREAAGR